MKVPAKASPELLYYLAQDFIRLSAKDKFRIGKEMHLLDPFDVLALTEEDAERRIFSEAYKRGKLETLIRKIYEGQYDG